MVEKYSFELELEKIAEKFYFNAASQLTSARGGNSRGNEVYFGNISTELREKLQCQQLILPKGECPDSGIFGIFNYKKKDEINWNKVISGEIIVLEVLVPNNQKRYLDYNVSQLSLPNLISKETEIKLKLNDLEHYGEFFGIEYKASKNKNPNNISVASFNSTCPSPTKTTELANVIMIHNIPSRLKKCFDGKKDLKTFPIKLSIQFSMYYFIVNDEEIGTRSEIRHILLCNGIFFAPTTSEIEASEYSKQIFPIDLGRNLNLYRVKLRYRPFFESRAIKANGFGLYTSWEPKIPAQAREERESEALLNEVEKIHQEINNEQIAQQNQPQVEEHDNVIYLDLRADRIRLRSVA